MIQVATGATHACALRYNGTVWCWGNYLPDGSTATTPTKVSKLKAVRAITAGSSHSCALKAYGSVWCWGDNASGQLGNGTTTDKRVPVRVTGLGAVRSISAGQSHTCAVT
ncbi:MAG: RCC1 domain-containing protein, partial [Solirubrobacterales bacterium]